MSDLWPFLLGVALGAILASLSFWRVVCRRLLKPADVIIAASQDILSGNLGARSNLVGSGGLDRLGQSFDAMASHLQSSLDKLKEHETFLQSLIDADPDGLRVLAADGTILMANRAYCRMLGVEREQTLGKPCYASSHRRTEPCAPTLITCPLHEITVRGEPVKTVQAIHLKDGAEHQVEVHAAPLTTPDGRLLVVESIRDLASDIRFSHEQKLSAIGQLAAGVAHEIRNPLASVRLALQSLIKQGEEGRVNIDSLMDYLKLVDSQIDKCIDVTTRLLKLSVNQSGQMQIVPVRTAIEETVSLLSFEAEKSKIDIVLNLPAKELSVMATDGDFRMVMLNLMQNAFHAMPKGGKLTVAASADERWVDIEVADTGIGIKPEMVGRIFQPFFTSRADGVQGSGIGLTICKGIVEGSGGAIDVVSRSGEGAKFIVRLPRPGII
ncbi:MAG: ATP-binding protein [Rhodospirillales bacterium]|nr:ATP-binding protein [Rhodospirillales bacterium]